MDEAKAERFMEITGTKERMIYFVKILCRKVSEKFSVPYPELLKIVDMDEIIKRATGMMVEFYTEEEIDAVIEFHSTPVGRRIKDKIPQATGMLSELAADIMQRQVIPAVAMKKHKKPSSGLVN